MTLTPPLTAHCASIHSPDKIFVNLQQRRLLRLEENPTFLILYLNVNLKRHLVVVHHDDFDRRMVHIPVQVDHFVEEIQALQRPLTLSRNHVVENNANCLNENIFVAKLGPHVLLFDDRSIPEINKKHQNFFRYSRSVLEWSVAQNSTPIPLTVIPPEQNLIMIVKSLLTKSLGASRHLSLLATASTPPWTPTLSTSPWTSTPITLTQIRGGGFLAIHGNILLKNHRHKIHNKILISYNNKNKNRLLDSLVCFSSDIKEKDLSKVKED